MSNFDWALIAYFAAVALATILMIGRKRDPITPGTAAITVLISAALIAGVILL